MKQAGTGSNAAGGSVESVAADLIGRWKDAVTGRDIRVALTDGHDARVIRAAARMHEVGLLVPRLVGEHDRIVEGVREQGVDLPDETILDTRVLGSDAAVAARLAERMVGKRAEIRDFARADPAHLAAAAWDVGLVDCCLGGATSPTAEILRAGLRTVGLRTGVSTLSSAFLMVLPDGRVLTFADCAVVPDPTEAQLADIAVAAAGTHSSLVGQRPRVAMLSFSTRGSAEHAEVDRVRTATELTRQRLRGGIVDGEMQFDAAVEETVNARKAPGSTVGGRANVLIFPNLDAGNIGYKITERFGGAIALGPVLQGLRASFNDLSRGCSVADIELMALLGAVQSLEHAAGV